jgi:hypothetical protein
VNLIYFSRSDCGVCEAVKPNVAALLDRYPQINGCDCSLDEDPVIAGQLSLYNVPVILIYRNSRELLRIGRFIVMSELEPQIQRLLENFGKR